MEYKLPEVLVEIQRALIKKRITLAAVGILLIAALISVAFYYGLIGKHKVSPASPDNESPVTATIELRSLPGKITQITEDGFVIEPLEGLIDTASLEVVLQPKAMYEIRGEQKTDEQYQKDIAEYQDQVNLATQGDTSAQAYIRFSSRPETHHFTLITRPTFSIGDYVLVKTNVLIPKDASSLSAYAVRLETLPKPLEVMPSLLATSSIDRVEEPSSSPTSLNYTPIPKENLGSLLASFFTVPVAEAASCPQSPPNGGSFTGSIPQPWGNVQTFFSIDFSPGQYMTGFRIRTNCDRVSSEDSCIDVKTDSLGVSDMFYQPNGGVWTGFATYNTVDLGPGEYISGIQYRENCDFKSSEDGCINVKVASASAGTSAYRVNSGSWTGWTYSGYYSDEFLNLSAGEYVSGIDFKTNCDGKSTEDACIRFKISTLTTADGLCAPTNQPPTAPGISGPTALDTGVPGTYTFTSSDPDAGDFWGYGVDWDLDGSVDNWIGHPSNTIAHSWPSAGTYTFQVLAQDNHTANSGWSSYTVTVTDAGGGLASLNISPSTITLGQSITFDYVCGDTKPNALNILSSAYHPTDSFGTVIGPAAGSVSWTPQGSWTGTRTYILNCYTTFSGLVSASKSITVNAAGSCSPVTGTSCQSSPNSCFMRNTGTIGSYPTCACSATVPLDSACAPPVNLTQPGVSHVLGSFNGFTNMYDTVTVQFQTSNSGGVSTSPVNPQYRMRFDKGANSSYDDTQTGAIGILSAGQTSAMLSKTFTSVPFGLNEVEVAVDEPNAVTESNEGDNIRVYNFNGMIPPPDPGLTLTASKTQVRKDETIVLNWGMTTSYPMNCRLFGPGLNVVLSGTSGVQSTNGITAKSEFTLRCVEPITTTAFTKTVIVETTGEIQEI